MGMNEELSPEELDTVAGGVSFTEMKQKAQRIAVSMGFKDYREAIRYVSKYSKDHGISAADAYDIVMSQMH